MHAAGIGVLLCIGLAAIALTLGATTQAQRMRRDARLLVAPDARVDIGGRRLYLAVSGEARAGAPVVVIESGLGHVSTVWSLVVPEVATFARVCVSDRAGYGWSDPGPEPRTSAQIARNLRTALRAADLAPPYLLVGHSFGGLNMVTFACQHPDEVAGMVLLDPLPPHIASRDPASFRFFVNWNTLHYRTLSVLTGLGLFRLWLAIRGLDAGPAWIRRMPPGIKPRAVRELLRGTYAAARDETAALPESARAASAYDTLPDVPVVVLAHGIPDLFTNRMSRREVLQAEDLWGAMQAQLAAQAPQGRFQVVASAGHKIHVDQPAVVIATIRQVLAQCCVSRPS
jgi:pimeloyl-ACP methyl ester carboxylesterase